MPREIQHPNNNVISMQILEIFPCIWFKCQGFSSRGGCRGGFCEVTPEAIPMLDKVSSSQLQDGPTTGQS